MPSQESPIRKSRQRVVHREVLKFCLSLLAGRHILQMNVERIRLTLRITQKNDDLLYVNDFAVRTKVTTFIAEMDFIITHSLLEQRRLIRITRMEKVGKRATQHIPERASQQLTGSSIHAGEASISISEHDADR
ncbi:hypothetical protein GCM10028800_03480 [Nesterenkonia populi]